MAVSLTHFVAGAVVAPPSVVAVPAVSRFANSLRIFDRLGVGASTWAGPGLESGAFAVRGSPPGWLLPKAGGHIHTGLAREHTV
jgi:hypothetical protein